MANKDKSVALAYYRTSSATNVGEDKGSLDSRVQWVDNNWEMIERIAEDPYSNKEWIDPSKKKNKSFQRLAAIFDITRKDGMSSVPVQLDGQCNGSQHWAAIMKDKSIGSKVGMTVEEKPSDLYQHVADTTTDYCKLNIKSKKWCKKFMDYWSSGIDRKVTKRSTMCDAYGLTFYGIQKYLKVEGHLDWVQPKEQGGAIVELARAIQNAMNKCNELPNKGKDWLKSIVVEANNLNRHIEYYTPSGFKVVHYYNVIQTRRSVAKLFDRKELAFFLTTPDVNTKAALLAIAPNFIHSLDAAHMFLTIRRMILNGIFSFSMIHDSYGCHCNDVDVMRDILREEFVKMHSVNQLEKFRSDVQNQLGIMLPEVPDTGDLDVTEVLLSDYFFA